MVTLRSSYSTRLFLFLVVVNVLVTAENRRVTGTKATPKFIRRLLRQLFEEQGTLKQKRNAAETHKSKEESESTKKQVVNSIHIGPHLGPPQGSIGNGYFGDAGFPVPVPAVLPAGHRSDIEKDNGNSNRTEKQEQQKRWSPYGLGYPFAPNTINHGYGLSVLPYGYGSGFPGYGPMFVRCEMPKQKDKPAKRCFGFGGFGSYGGFGWSPGFYPGFGGYFPGFADRPVYSSLPWQKSAKKNQLKRWFDGFGFGGLGLGMGLGFGHNHLIGYPGYGYGTGHYGGFDYFPYGFCKSGVPGEKGEKGKEKERLSSKKRCFGSYLGVPGFGYGLGYGSGVPGYGLGFGLGYGYGYPGYGYPFGFYRSKVPKCRKNDKRCLHGLEYPYGLYPAFGCSSALCGGYGFGMSGNMWGMGGPFYPGGYLHGLYRSNLPKGKENHKKGDRKHIIGYHPGIYGGLTGVFYPAVYPSSFSYGFPNGYGFPVYGEMSPFGFYRSEIPQAKTDEKGEARDEIEDPFDFLERRQVIGPSLGGSLHGDGQGLGIGYPGAANLIQPGIAGVGDYGLGGGYSGIPLGLGNTGFGGYGMAGFGLGPGLSAAFGGDLAEGGFGPFHRSLVQEFTSDENNEGQDEELREQDDHQDQYQPRYVSEATGSAVQSKRQAVPFPVQHMTSAPMTTYSPAAPIGVPSFPVVHEPEAVHSSPFAQPLLHPFAPYAVPPTRNIHVGSPHVKVDVQTTRSNIEERGNAEKRSTEGDQVRVSKRQVSPVFTPISAEPLGVPPVRYPVPPADAYPYGAGIAWPSVRVPSNSGHPPFVWSRSTLPGILAPRGFMGGMGGMGGGPMGGGMEMGIGGGMSGGMGGGLGALLGGGMNGGMMSGMGGGMAEGINGGLGGGMGALMGGGMGGTGSMGVLGMPGLAGMSSPSSTSNIGGLGAIGGEAVMGQSPINGFSTGEGNDGGLSAALPGSSSIPGMAGVQKKSGVPVKAKGKKTISMKKAKN